MKILHVISQRPDSTGSGTYLRAILHEAARNGHENYLIAGLNSEKKPTNAELFCLESTFINFDRDQLDFPLPGMSDVMPYHSSRFRDLTDKQLMNYKSCFRDALLDLHNKVQPDIIHSHHLFILTSLLKDLFPQTPLITSCHGSDLRQIRQCSHLRQEIIHGCRKIDLVFALSKNQIEDIHTLYSIPEGNIYLAGAGFNNQLFSFHPKSRMNDLQIVYCGKISRAKGVPWMLEALRNHTRTSFHLHLVGSGSGSEYEECMDTAKSLGDKITIHGALPQIKLAELLKKSHVFLLPSLFEGLPLVVLEALGCGCSVITTDLPGCMEISEQIDDQSIAFIQVPRLHSIDKPFKEDEKSFIAAIGKQIDNLAQHRHEIERRTQYQVEKNTHPFIWSNVFSGIEKQYERVIKTDAFT